MLTLSNINTVETPLVLTGGGPGTATRILPLEVFDRAFVSYDLGSRFAQKYLHAQSARVAVSGRNLYQWLDKSWTGFDPEGVQSSGNDITATENFALGGTRYFMARLNIVF